MTALILSVFLILAALYFATAHSLAVLYRGAENVLPSDPLPAFVWHNVAAAATILLLGFAYFFRLAYIRRWFVVVSTLALVYGIHGFLQTSPAILSWSGIWHEDLLALEAARDLFFCVLGTAGLAASVMRRPEQPSHDNN